MKVIYFAATVSDYELSPYQHMEKYIVPGLRALGYSEDQVETAIAMIYGRTGGKNMVQWHRQFMSGAMDKKIHIDENAMGAKEAMALAKTSPKGGEEAIAAAFLNLKIAAGESIIPIIVPAFYKLAEGLRWLGRWINRHPVKFDYLIKGFAGLSAAMLFGGTVLALKAAFMGLGLLLPPLAGMITVSLIPALTALSAALVPLAAIAYHKEIAGKIDSTSWGQSLGDNLYRIFTPEGRNDLVNDRKRMSVVPPAPKKETTMNTTINMDGRKVAQSVSKHQYGEMNRAPASGGDFDGRRSYVAPGYAYFAP